MQQIPVTTNGNSSVEVTLDGSVFEIYTYLNSRNNRLYLDILVDGSAIVSGIRLIENNTPIAIYSFDGLPPGLVLMAQLNSISETATLGNTGIDLDYSLTYEPVADLVE